MTDRRDEDDGIRNVWIDEAAEFIAQRLAANNSITSTLRRINQIATTEIVDQLSEEEHRRIGDLFFYPTQVTPAPEPAPLPMGRVWFDEVPMMPRAVAVDCTVHSVVSKWMDAEEEKVEAEAYTVRVSPLNV